MIHLIQCHSARPQRIPHRSLPVIFAVEQSKRSASNTLSLNYYTHLTIIDQQQSQRAIKEESMSELQLIPSRSCPNTAAAATAATTTTTTTLCKDHKMIYPSYILSCIYIYIYIYMYIYICIYIYTCHMYTCTMIKPAEHNNASGFEHGSSTAIC